MKPDTIEPNKTKPFSHLITGIVLRAFAAHPKYRTDKDVINLVPERQKPNGLFDLHKNHDRYHD